jgi:hypothetical protein
MSVGLRNARLDAIETFAGTAAKLMIYSGSMPANAGAATSGTKLAEWDMASDWAGDAASGQKSLSSLPLSGTGLANGTCGYWRLFKSDGTTCVMQGDVTAAGGGGSLTVDNVSIANGQGFNVTGFTITEGNA